MCVMPLAKILESERNLPVRVLLVDTVQFGVFHGRTEYVSDQRLFYILYFINKLGKNSPVRADQSTILHKVQGQILP